MWKSDFALRPLNTTCMKALPSLLFCLIFLFNSPFSVAQSAAEPIVLWSNKSFWPDQESTKGGFVIIDENRYVLVSIKGKSHPKLLLELFDKRNLEQVVKKEIALGNRKKRYNFHQISMVGDKLTLFTSKHNAKFLVNTLYRQQVDLSNLHPSDRTEIAKSFTDGFTNTFGINMSKDKSKLLVYGVNNVIPSDPMQVNVHVFDTKFKQLWQHKYILPYQNKDYSIVQNVIDNQGNVYLIGDYAEGKSHKKHQGRLFYLEADGTTKEQNFGVAQKFLNDLEYHIDEQGILVAAGTFTNVTRIGDLLPIVEGIYFFQYNPLSDKLGQRIVYFDSHEFRQNNTAISEKGRFESHLYLKQVFIKKDNSILLALEQYEPIDGSTNLAPRGSIEWGVMQSFNDNQFLKYYKDVVLVNVKDFKVDWVTNIPKKQRLIAHHKATASYTTLQKGEDLYFIYNDTKLNYEESPKKVHAYNQLKTEEQALVVKKLTMDGQWETFIPAWNQDFTFPICTFMSKPLSENELLLFGDFGEYFRFGSLKL